MDILLDREYETFSVIKVFREEFRYAGRIFPASFSYCVAKYSGHVK